MNALYAGRKIRNQLFILMCTGAALFGLMWLGLILTTLIVNGVQGLNVNLFTLSNPPPGDAGGLLNSIVGSVMMILIAVVVGTPIGVLAGTYLAEYGRFSKFAATVRILNDILLSAPSIVVGLFVYELVVVPMGHFSGWAGAFALAVIVIPVVVRTSENMLLLIPDSQREAAAALGVPAAYTIRRVLWRAARTGIITGVLLAVARISGETAPLLFTALNNQFLSFDINHPMGSMPYAIYNFALSPYEDWHRMAWAGALVITATVLTLSILARLLVTGDKR
jgi:phosphate transport system permease protein